MNHASATIRTARHMLGVDEHAEAAAIRTAFLRHVRDHQFNPPAASVTALAALDERLGPNNEQQAFQRRLESTLEGDINTLGEQYWQLAPEERRARWSELNTQAARFPRLRFRLNELETGLDILPPDNLPLDLSGDLVRMITATYPLAPAVRADRWIAYRRGINNQAAFRVAVRQMQRQYPLIIALGGSWVDPEQSITANEKFPTLPKGLQADESTAAASSSSAGAGRYAWLAIVLVVGFIRVIVALGDKEPKPIDPYRNPYVSPVQPPKFEFPQGYTFPNANEQQERDREFINKYLRDLEKRNKERETKLNVIVPPKENRPIEPVFPNPMK